jgi:hypothetical protein
MPNNVEEHYQRQTIPTALAVIVAAALLLVASIVFSFAASRLLAARASRSWRMTEGVIIESRLPSNCSHCWPVINYRYVVDGQSFVGDHLVAGPQDYYGPRDAEAKTGLYSVGRKVNVYYDPANSAISCLEPGILRWSAYLFLGIAVCCLGVALFLFWRLYRARPIFLAGSADSVPANRVL